MLNTVLQKERDIRDLRAAGIDVIELQWIKQPTLIGYQHVCGFQDYAFHRSKQGGATSKKLINDAPITFRGDDRNVGYAYMPKDRTKHETSCCSVRQ